MKITPISHARSVFGSLLFIVMMCCVGAADNVLSPVPRATSLIVDQTGLLSVDERSGIELRLREVQASGRAQIGVLIAPDPGLEPLAQYALRVAESWKLGRAGADNGLLILIVPSRTAARIEVGYGLEGAIPDVTASRWVDALHLDWRGRGPVVAIHLLLDRIVNALPPPPEVSDPYSRFLKVHPKWDVALTLLVFSLVGLLPLIVTSVRAVVFSSFAGSSGRGSLSFPPLSVCLGALLSAAIFAALHGFAARSFWESEQAGYRVAMLAFPLPLLVSLNVCRFESLGALLRIALVVGDLLGFLWLFGIITLFAGMGLHIAGVKELWAAPLFGLLMACVPPAFMLPGAAVRYLGLFLRSYVHFLIALGIAYVALQAIVKEPTAMAIAAAGLFASLAAVGLWLDSRELRARAPASGPRKSRPRRWSMLFMTVAVLFLLPFALVALAHAFLGDAFYAHFVTASTRDGSFAELVWWTAGGLGSSALLIGLGGRFGGGGAGR